jgi:hypothetical protein
MRRERLAGEAQKGLPRLVTANEVLPDTLAMVRGYNVPIPAVALGIETGRESLDAL